MKEGKKAEGKKVNLNNRRRKKQNKTANNNELFAGICGKCFTCAVLINPFDNPSKYQY